MVRHRIHYIFDSEDNEADNKILKNLEMSLSAPKKTYWLISSL